MTIQTKIISCASYLSKTVTKSADFFSSIGLQTKYGIPNNWMSRIMGIKEKREAASDQQPSYLAFEAASSCINKINNFDISNIDAVIFCGIEKDQKEPETAHNVQKKLGTKAKYVFDVSNAFFGFFDGIELGNVTSATLPVVFEEMEKQGRLKRGHNIGGAFAGSGLIIGQFGYTA